MISVKFSAGAGIFLFGIMTSLTLGLIQPFIPQVMRALSPGLKWPGHETGHSPPSVAKFNNAWRYIVHHTSLWCGTYRHRDNFIFRNEILATKPCCCDHYNRCRQNATKEILGKIVLVLVVLV
jgi:hypothetical protein